jgi:hypothetical protein
MYEKAIVDELGCVVAWLVGMSDEDVSEWLEKYPEHRITCVLVG